MIISIRHWLLNGNWGGTIVYGGGTSQGIAQTTALANIIASGISEISAVASTTGLGNIIMYAEGDTSAIVDTYVSDVLLIKTGHSSINALAITSVYSNIIYSVDCETEGYADTWCYAINAKETIGEVLAIATTLLTANYITFSDGSSDAIVSTTLGVIIKKFATSDIQATGTTTLTGKAIYSSTVAIDVSCSTTCLGARLVEFPSLNILSQATTEAIGGYGLGALSSIYVRQNGQWTFQSQYNRQMYLDTNRISIGSPTTNFIKFKTDRLYLEP